MPKDIMVKGVDPETYRRAKATAALGGISMGRAVSDALERWIEEKKEIEMESEYRRDMDFVRREWKKQLQGHRGKAVVVSSGRLEGVFDSYERACGFAERYRVALTFVVGDYPEESEIEIGPDLEVQRRA
jgi:hypothetical protein